MPAMGATELEQKRDKAIEILRGALVRRGKLPLPLSGGGGSPPLLQPPPLAPRAPDPPPQRDEPPPFRRPSAPEPGNTPAMACLAPRILYGSPVTAEKLSQVERAEHLLRSLGFRELRVRHHDETARIELAAVEISR